MNTTLNMLACLIILLTSNNISANNKVDSIVNSIIKKDFSSKNLYIVEKVYRVNLSNGNLKDSASNIQFLLKAIEISKQYNSKEYESVFNSYLAMFYSRRNKRKNLEVTDSYLSKAFNKATSNYSLGRYWLAKGLYYQNIHSFSSAEALKCFLTAEQYFTKASHNLGLSHTYYSISTVYDVMLIEDKQLEYARKALLAINLEQEATIGDRLFAHFSLGNAYFLLYYDTRVKNRKYRDSAITQYKEIIAFEQKGVSLNLGIINTAFYNLAVLYDLDSTRKSLDSALYYMEKYELTTTKDVARSSNNIGIQRIFKSKLLVYKGQLDSAQNILNEVLSLYENKHIEQNAKVARFYYEVCSLIAFRRNKLANAFEFKEKQLRMMELMLPTEKVEATQKIETNFKNYKQEQELIQSKKDNSFRKKLNYLYLFVALLSVAGLLFLYRSFAFKKKILLQQQLLLEKEKQEATLQAKINEEEAIAAMMEKEISDQEKKLAIQETILTQQQRDGLQNALMYNTLQVNRKNNLIKELQHRIAAINNKNAKEGIKIDRMLEHSIETDEELDFIQQSLSNTSPTFFKTLQERAQQSLTNLDIKYCAYIKMGMSIREISQIMNVEQKSVRMTRYRLKQKLQLSKEEDLDTYVGML